MRTTTHSEPSQGEIQKIIDAYRQMVEDRLDIGFEATLLTFMFSPFGRFDGPRGQQMRKAIETIYAKHLTHVHRHPHREPLMALPLWIACPDWPVPKAAKLRLPDVVINGGQHVHAVALTPPFRRLRGTLADHFDRDRRRYAGPERPVERVDAVTITETPRKAVGYLLKSLSRRRANSDDVLLLPRTHGEM